MGWLQESAINSDGSVWDSRRHFDGYRRYYRHVKPPLQNDKDKKVIRPPRADYLECLHLRLQSLLIAPRAAIASDASHGNTTIGMLTSFVKWWRQKAVRPPRADYSQSQSQSRITSKIAIATGMNIANGILTSFVRYGEIIEKHRDKKRRLVVVFLSLPVFVEKLREL